MLDFLLNNWFIGAILSTGIVGVVAFINKIFAEKKYDQRFLAIILYGNTFVISLGYLFLNEVHIMSVAEVVTVIIWGVLVYVYTIIMLTALRYLPTSTYFVNVRLGSSFALLLIGIFFFNDVLSTLEIIGLIIGVAAMILLFEKEEKSGVNYRKGIGVLFLGIITLVVAHTMAKTFSMDAEKVPTVLSILFASSFVVSLLAGFKTIKNNKKNFLLIFLVNVIQALLYFFYHIIILNVYRIGDLGISYKIQSYSPFIPIILAAIIYKEKITIKKKIALALVAVSLWFFM